jgi:hypothetical protein
MSETFSFSQERIDSVLRTFENEQISAQIGAAATSSEKTADVTIAAECISVTVQNGEVCLNLPLGLGSQCIDIPDWVPNGEAARACLSIKYRRVLGVKIPTGVKACVYVADTEVACVEYGL